MEKLFIPFELAVKLKEKGFDEPCFGYHENNTLDPECPKLIINFNNTALSEEQSKRPGLYRVDNRNSCLAQWAIAAPTYQQVIDWFRDKKIHIGFTPFYDFFTCTIKDFNTDKEYEFNEYEFIKGYYPLQAFALDEALRLI